MPKRKAPPTAWKPGQSGNPDGRKAEKLIADQLRLVLMDIDPATGYKRLRMLAEKMVDQAIEGHAAQQSMILDRIDGKVPQETHNTLEAGDSLAELLKAIDGRSRDIVAPAANGHDTATDEDTVH